MPNTSDKDATMNADRIMAISELSSSRGQPTALADPNFDYFRNQSRTFQAMAKYSRTEATVSGASSPMRANVARVSSDFLKVFSVQPIVGRDFVADGGLARGDCACRNRAYRSRASEI